MTTLLYLLLNLCLPYADVWQLLSVLPLYTTYSHIHQACWAPPPPSPSTNQPLAISSFVFVNLGLSVLERLQNHLSLFGHSSFPLPIASKLPAFVFSYLCVSVFHLTKILPFSFFFTFCIANYVLSKICEVHLCIIKIVYIVKCTSDMCFYL